MSEMHSNWAGSHSKVRDRVASVPAILYQISMTVGTGSLAGRSVGN